jgi:hypothetical protein
LTGLYPTSVVDTPTPNNIYTIDHGRLMAFPFEVTEGFIKRITVTHFAVGIQDHSLRAWVSRADDIGGRTLGTEQLTAFWNPNRSPTETVIVYHDALEPAAQPAIALPLGSYYVNVLNLVNSRNGFQFLLTDLD